MTWLDAIGYGVTGLRFPAKLDPFASWTLTFDGSTTVSIRDDQR